MSDERIYKLLTLVLLCRQNTEIFIELEISNRYEAVNIYGDDGKDWRYSTEEYLDSFVDGNWHRVRDENLEQAEQHLIRLLKVKEGK